MDASELFLKDGCSAGVFYCGACKIVSRTEAEAEQCCRPNICACGAECRQYWTACDQCVAAEREAKDAAQWGKAAKIPEAEYDGPVYDDLRGEYFADVESAMEAREQDCDEEDAPAPVTHIYTCDVRKVSVDIDGAIEQAEEEGPGESVDWVALDELRAFVEQWNARQSAEWWECDDSRGIVVEASTPATEEPTP